jgi:hypothetical protein
MNAPHNAARRPPGYRKPEIHEPNRLDPWALGIYSLGLGLIALYALFS